MLIRELPSRDDELHPVDALDAGDLALDHLGDPLLDHLGRGAAVGGLDRDHRRVDAGQLAHRQRQEGGQAHDAEDDRRDRGEDRPPDGEVGERHAAGRSAPGRPWPRRAAPAIPARRRAMPGRPGPGCRPPATRDRLAGLHLVEAVGDDPLAGLHAVQ